MHVNFWLMFASFQPHSKRRTGSLQILHVLTFSLVSNLTNYSLVFGIIIPVTN